MSISFKSHEGFDGHDCLAFTLIELLVVIGIIGALAAGTGLALRDNDPSSALRSAQSLTVSALSAARGQAALNQKYAKIIVQADKDKENFLRLIRIVVGDDAVSGPWTQVGSDILLPQKVYIVPNGSVSGVTFAGTGRRSTFLAAPASVPGVSADSNSWFSSGTISPLGVVTSSGNIVVGSGRETGPSLVAFDNYESVRGLAISRYGVATLLNEAASLGL